MSETRRTGLFGAAFNGLLLAVSFLTRIPVRVFRVDDDVWRWSFAFYPLCGLLTGLVASLPLLAIPLGPRVSESAGLAAALSAPFLYVLISQWMTRMLHFDGFCDCCDGFSAMRATPEERLRIMKDPHVGASALAGGILLLAGKIIFAYLIWVDLTWGGGGDLPHFEKMLAVFVAAPVLGRLAVVALAAIGTYPREVGTAVNVVGKVPLASMAVAALSTAPAFYLLSSAGFGFRFILTALVFSAALVAYWRMKSSSKIGGVTGDVLGACCETVELAVLAAFLF